MSDLVIESRQINIELIIIVVSEHLEHGFIQPFLFHDCSYHVAVNELIYFFDRHVHPVVGADVPL